MSFIHKFLDLVERLPRHIVRLLYLYKEVEERYSELNSTLERKREIYLRNLKERAAKKNVTLKSLKLIQKELISLSDYKIELLKELKYSVQSSFLDKLPPILKEGKKEVQEQLTSKSHNKMTSTISLSSKLYYDEDKKNIEKKSVDRNDRNQDNNSLNSSKLLNKKKHRPKTLKKTKEDLSSESSNKILEDIKLDVYCKCKRESYGKMIQCDNPECAEWFHYECIGIKEGNEPKEWYCCEKCKEKGKKVKHKILRIK